MMDAKTFLMVVSAVIGFVGSLSMGIAMTFIYYISKVMKRKKNYIDVDIYEFNGNSCMLRHEIGRKVFDNLNGHCYVTAGKGSKIKDNLGPNISDNDILPVKLTGFMNMGRKYLAVGTKDGVSAPLRIIDKSLNLTKEEKKSLDDLKEKYKSSIEVSENPVSFSLKPIKADQTTFVLDNNRKLQKNFNEDQVADAWKRMMTGMVTIFVIGLIVILIMFIVMFSQGPSMVEAIRNIPG